MKKLFALVAFLACMTTANAQYYVGGSFAFTTSKLDAGGADQSGSSFKILPDVGYQFSEDMSFGIQVGYSHGFASFGSLTASDIKGMISSFGGLVSDINDEDLKLNSFTIAPYIRYNVLKFDRIKCFVEGYIGYDSVTSDVTPSTSGTKNSDTKISAFEIGVRPGIALSLSNNIDMTCKLGALGFISGKESESDMKITRFGFNADTYNLMWGLNYKF